MFNTKLILAYKGTNYCGFQLQAKNGVPTVQHHINEALSIIFGETITTNLCSRTDAGVHANGQVINFRHQKDKFKDNRRLLMAVNAHLPRDIRVVSSEKVDFDFHSRYHAKGKLYSYTIDNFIAHRPLMADFSYHVPYPLNLEDMHKASKHFIGTHDFASFKGSQGATKTTVRTITSLEVAQYDHYVKIFAKGNGFLYNMVRIIAGTLVDVGKGKIAPDHIPAIIEARDRLKAGPTAPAHGLVLEEIFY